MAEENMEKNMEEAAEEVRELEDEFEQKIKEANEALDEEEAAVSRDETNSDVSSPSETQIPVE